MGTDKYHIQVSHHLRVGKNALKEYDQYAIYLSDNTDIEVSDAHTVKSVQIRHTWRVQVNYRT